MPDGAVVKDPPANSGDMGSITGSGRSPRVGNGNPLPFSCLENFPWAGEPGGYSPWGHKESDMTEYEFSCARVCVCVCVHVHTHTHTYIQWGYINMLVSMGT